MQVLINDISAVLNKFFRKGATNFLLILLTLFSVEVSASTFSAVYDSYQDRIVITLQCSSYCDYYKKVGSSWSLISSPWSSQGALTYTYTTPSPGKHEFKLETGGYTNTGWGIIEVDQRSVVVPIKAQETSYEYDELGRLKKVTRTGGSETSYEYDDADNRTSKNVSN